MNVKTERGGRQEGREKCRGGDVLKKLEFQEEYEGSGKL